MAYLDEKNGKNDQPFSKFIGRYEKETADGYRRDLNHCFNFLYTDGTNDEKAKRLIDGINDGTVDMSDVLSDYLQFMKGKNYSPLTINKRLSIIKNFLKKSKINEDFQITGKVPPRMAQNTTDIIGKSEIRQLLLVSTPMLRALILMAVSSGMRIGEILKMTPDWLLDQESGFIQVRIPGYVDGKRITKNGQPRTTFFTPETVDALRAWMNYRPVWIQSIRTFTDAEKEKTLQSPKIFPISRANVEKMMIRALKKAGLTDTMESGYYRVHFHGFRKYFRTQLAKGDQNALDFVESYMGHTGYLTSQYLRLTVDEKFSWYRRNSFLVSVGDSFMVDDVETKEELKRLKAKVDDMESANQKIAYLTSLLEKSLNIHAD